MAVVSCHAREGYSNVIRSTWLPLFPKDQADILFFRGRGATREPLEDEVFLDCDDSYEGLPEKVQSIVRWAYEHSYDYVLKLDDDVVVKPRELLASGFEKWDFVGGLETACKPNEIQTPWGFAYWLSRKCMRLVIDTPLPGQPGSTHPQWHNNDEAWVSTILHINGIFLHNDHRYWLHRGDRVPPKRSLRAPKRDYPLSKQPPVDVFAICVYLNWGGFHMTPTEEILREIKMLFERYK